MVMEETRDMLLQKSHSSLVRTGFVWALIIIVDNKCSS